MSPDFDVIVVGAGPAGSITARELARAQVGSVLLVDQAEMPRVKACAGGISPYASVLLRQLGLLDAILARTYTINAARLVGPSGHQTILRTSAARSSHQALVLPRTELDAALVSAAVQAGATFRPKARVGRLLEQAGRVTGVRIGEEQITARWVVVAAGATSPFHWDARPTRTLDTCMAWFDGMAFVPHRLEMFFDAELCPHYGWLFPESDTRVNVGLCVDAQRRSSRNVRDRFGAFLERHLGKRLAGARQVGDWRGHPILGTDWIEHVAPPGVLVVGEAARLVNVATGEGITNAIRSGMAAASAIARARPGTDPQAVAAGYTQLLRRRAGWGLLAGEVFCRVGATLVDAFTRVGSLTVASRLTHGVLATADEPA